MKTRLLLPLLVVVAAFGTSCDSSTEPSQPAIDHLEIRLSPSRPFYPVHDTTRASVIAHLPDGTTRPAVSVVWRSLTPALNAVEQSGLITMLGRGNATVEVEAEGVTARVQLLVQGILHFDAIRGRETWLAADGPHVVRGYLTVGGVDTAVLTVEPGATVLFRPRSGLDFGAIDPGRMVIPPGGAAVTIEGDSVGTGSWVGLAFAGAGQSELRNVTFRHCGAPRFDVLRGCILAYRNAAGWAPRLLIDGVTITGARHVGMTLENFVTLAPGSRNLTIVDGDGHIATISPELAGDFPLGGRLEGNAENAVWIGTGLVGRSITWRNLGVPWRLVGQISVDGPGVPVLTLPAGLHVRSDALATLGVGSARLVIGNAAGPPVLLESSGAGWRGIGISDGAGPSSLTRVVMRDCGLSEGACISLLGGIGAGTRLHVEDVTIRGSRGVGIFLTAEARFDAASTNLTITESADVPLEMPADAVPSIPQGDYRGNARDVIRLRWGGVTRTATWRNPGVPYLAPEGLDIRHHIDDPILTVERGVVLQMGNDTRVVVADVLPGALRVLGTASEPVLFTSVTPGVAGSWIGVELGTSADTRTRLDYADIRDAGAGDPGFAGAVRMWVDPGGVLRNTTIRRSTTCGVVLFDGSVWTDDYADPQFGNVFIDVAGPTLCRPSS